MKKITALLILILTWYIAGKYRYISLMILAFTELALLMVMFVLPKITKHFFNMKFSAKNQTAHKNVQFPCDLKINNRNVLPLNHLQVKMYFQYKNFPKNKKMQKLLGFTGYKSKEQLRFQIQAPYCGLLQAKLVSCQVYDCFALFSSHKKLKQYAQVAVLPQQNALNIDFSNYNQNGGNDFGEHTVLKNGDDHNEILQLREYRNGDSMRTVHWNYSAKTDQLWVKEYSHEADKYIHLIADTSTRQKYNIKDMDAFYEILSAMVQGLIQQNIPVCVYWYNEEKGGLQFMEVTDSNQREEMLLQLYQSPISAQAPVLAVAENSPVMQLNLNLEWSFNHYLIYRFSKTDFENEINQYIFTL